jgi:hypothetical protein
VKSLIVVAAMFIAAWAAPVRAQEQRPAAPGGATTLKVQVVLSRFQGDKKISSLPYTLTLTTDPARLNSGHANLRLGTQVPITTMTRQGSDEKAALVPSVQYRDVGTNIDCNVTGFDDGRYKLQLSVEDSSVDTGPGNSGGANSSHPTFRSFRTDETMLLRDGQSVQYSTATDKVSSDVWKVDVTLTIVK